MHGGHQPARNPAIRIVACVALALALAVAPMPVDASGHGPVFGLATPTLGRGAWSLDVSAMGRFVGSRQAAMVRPLVSHGLTEDLQISVSLPMPLYTPEGLPQARMMAMMPSNPDVEVLLGWRFHRNGTAVGARFESTAYLGLDYPSDARRGPVPTSPGLYAGAVTGFASRSIYVWAGALGRRYMSPVGPTTDRSGDLALYSLIIGYRPDAFRKELPHADWRVFVEVVGEYTGKDRLTGQSRPNTGGHQVFMAPTLLGLYGGWGISGGPAFPVYRKLNGIQPREKVRLVLNFTRWF